MNIMEFVLKTHTCHLCWESPEKTRFWYM